MAVTIFVVKASDIKGKRWDSGFHIYDEVFKNSIHDRILLSKYVKVNPIIKLLGRENTKMSFIPMNNVLDKNKGRGYTTEESTLDKSKGFTFFEKGDLIWALITPCMQNGKSVVLDDLPTNQGFGSTEFHVLRSLDNTKINIHYIHALLRMDKFLQESQLAFSGSAGQQRIRKDVLENLQIPFPSIDIQQEIADIMDNAYNQKQRLETEAEELLGSIDSYVMDKLGIEQTQETKSTEKWFTVRASEINGRRWGGFYNSAQTRDISNWKTLDSSLVSIFQGVGRNLIGKSDAILLKVKNIMLDGSINFDDTEYLDKYNKNKQLQDNDILTPAIGESVKLFKFSLFNHPTSDKYFVDNNTAVIRCISKNIYSSFLVNIFKTKPIKDQVLRLCGGGGVPFIGSALREIKIPIPPLEIQKEIAKECEERRNSAKQKQEFASKILFDAKEKIENMLFN